MRRRDDFADLVRAAYMRAMQDKALAEAEAQRTREQATRDKKMEAELRRCKSFRKCVNGYKRDLILYGLRKADGNVAKAARVLCMPKSTLMFHVRQRKVKI
jgi:transcriptional regulator with GAF, ATPase, and Fis domain